MKHTIFFGLLLFTFPFLKKNVDFIAIAYSCAFLTVQLIVFNRKVYRNSCYRVYQLRYALCTTTSVYRPTFLNSHKCTRRAVSAVVQSCSRTPKTWVQLLDFCCYRIQKLRFTLCHFYFRLKAAVCDIRHTQITDSKATVSPCSCYPTPKTCLQPMEFRCHRVYELRYALYLIYFLFKAAIFDFS